MIRGASTSIGFAVTIGGLAAGCNHYTSTTPTVPAGTTVFVTFPHTSNIPLVRGPGDTLWLPGVSRMIGRIQETRGDTVRLEVEEAHDARGPIKAIPRDATVLLSPSESTVIQTRQPDGGKTILGVLGILAAAWLLLGLGMQFGTSTTSGP